MRMFIGGEWVDKAEKIPVLNPYDGSTLDTVPKAEAEDVAQEVFEGVWKSLPQFDGRASIRTWLFTIAHHKCADALRKIGRTVTLEDANQTGETDPLPFSRAAGGQPELRDWLNRGLAKLSHEDRDVLLMSFVTELEPQEIAQQLGDHFAVKLLPAEITDKTIVARFEREMEILKTLKHPNIVRSFGGICEDKQRFYAMELVENGTLKSLLHKNGPLSWEQTVDYGLQICSALSYAHQRGIVHRDIKPGNFLLTKNGCLKLSDFGLISLANASSITADGKTLGTFRYMSPEQIRGRPEPSAQTDLYALGCVLFEMLTGTTPFFGKTPAETLHKHLNEKPPRVSESVPNCPAALDELIDSLLEKDIEKRPASAAEVARKLTDIAQSIVVETGRREVIRQQPPVEKQPATPFRFKPSGSAGWTLIVSIPVFVAFLIWNVSLSQKNQELAQAEELWINAYQHSNPVVRLEAAQALGQLAATSDSAVETLIKGLSGDKDPKVRAQTAEALGNAAANARVAISELVKRQKADEIENVRRQAGLAVKTIRASKEPSSFGWGSFLVGTTAVVMTVVLGRKLFTKSTV
ncbi:MAG: sigma-70 family RNA polymerase sigma factor [Planctomycetes bacterium]|nr:sigma-70 family RNA polymerase sigma factor [Planctomycetota bacterium]